MPSTAPKPHQILQRKKHKHDKKAHANLSRVRFSSFFMTVNQNIQQQWVQSSLHQSSLLQKATMTLLVSEKQNNFILRWQ